MAPQSTNRSYDMQGEQIIGEFLDKHFYPHLNHQGFERVKDKTRQIAGIDVILNIDDNVFLIDEKASTDYTDGRLDTFILELTNYSGKSIGWFLNEKLVTTHYLFVWINKISTEKIESVDCVKDIELAVVDKQTIRDHVRENLKLSDAELKRIADDITNGKYYSYGNVKYNGYKIIQCGGKKEKAICIKLPKSFYMDKAIFKKRIRVE